MIGHVAASRTNPTGCVAGWSGQPCRAAGVRAVFGVVLTLVTVLTISSMTHADHDDDEPAVAAGERQFNISQPIFDELVFGDSSGSAATAARKRMETAIESEIQFIERRCHLTNAQSKKLRLAGRGDIGTFFSRAEDLRKKVVGRSLDQQQYSELSLELSLLQMASQNNLLGDTSLFRKTLRRTLSDEQRAEYQLVIRQRQLNAAVAALTVWDRVKKNNKNANVIGLKLSPETRRTLCERIVEQGRLP